MLSVYEASVSFVQGMQFNGEEKTQGTLDWILEQMGKSDHLVESSLIFRISL